MEWMGNEYRLIAKSRCVSLCDLIAAACEAGIKVGVPLSLAEATHALENVYHGEEMLFDGAYQGLAQAYCVDRPWDEDKLREHMGDVPSHLYNYQWWSERSPNVGIPEVLYVANKSLVRKDDAKAIWERLCRFLFEDIPGDLTQFIGQKPLNQAVEMHFEKCTVDSPERSIAPNSLIRATSASLERKTASPSSAHLSKKLATLNQAAEKFWANADREDRGTHPKNADVAEWLTLRGYSQTLADTAASIIRPEWAPTGRKPEE
jgi:hypothetical protein